MQKLYYAVMAACFLLIGVLLAVALVEPADPKRNDSAPPASTEKTA